MADEMIFPVRNERQRAARQGPCAVCEEMLLDASDGLLSVADQAFFDRHLTGCVPCMEEFAQAQRGAALLAMLKLQRPEPSADLVERIFARTAGEQHEVGSAQQQAAGRPFVVPLMAMPAVVERPGNVIPFAPRPAVSRFAQWTRLAMEPRFAMTAAMAFFSIALTLNLTGVRLDHLHASNLNPLKLRRSYFAANAQAVRYCDNLRVVRVLESRVDDLRQAQGRDEGGSTGGTAKPQERKPEGAEPHGTSRRDPAPLAPLPAESARLETAQDPLRGTQAGLQSSAGGLA